jgi:N-acetyl-anhydromuramyl-L-alanine amidase AmpD/regulator of replication initiation timing
MAEGGVKGWILFTEELGNDPNDQRGVDYSRWADQGFGILARLNNGYEPNGTIPLSNRYASFAARCANFARNSRGCHIWIIGNEMNFAVERPGVEFDRNQNPPKLVRPGEIIQPGMYANCYRQCRAAIKAVAGHEKDQAIVGGVAPWNPQTTYTGNANGDWVKYLEDLLTILGPTNCDGIAIHAYTHGADPKLIYTDAFMNAPFKTRQYNFRTYQDFMKAIPLSMRHLPVYLTETDQDDAWRNENNGWVQRAYGEIDWWNRQAGNQMIRAVILYRWPNVDKWGIEGKAGVIEDFRKALTFKYNWETTVQAKPGATPAADPDKPKTDQPKPSVDPTTPPEQPPAEPTKSPVDTSPIPFAATGKTAKGLFAAFYRQYGLDLTGYPINNEYTDAQSGLKTQDWQRVSLEEWQGAIRLRLVGQEAVELRAKVTKLERQIAQLQSGAGGPLEPTITDITAQLPRDATRFIQRPPADIQYLVINHTGVRPEVGADRVAQAQRAKWPGIVGQYYITGDGAIQQTNPDDEVVTRDQNWIYNAVNIYVAGNFDESVPTNDQLDALAQLCAWLLNKYGLAEDAIRGVSEFIVTRSPGLQWLKGQTWKSNLLERVRAVPAGPAVPTPQPGDDDAITALQAQVSQLQAQVDDLQAQLATANADRARLQAQVEALLKANPAKLARPAVTDISPQLPRRDGSPKKRDTAQIKFIVINHTAVDPGVAAERIAQAHQQRWGAILYQYLVTADGNILQTNGLDEVVDLNQQWIAQGVNIAVAGNFTAEAPSEAQIKATAALCAWLMQEYKITAGNVKGVSEFIVTQSPGTQWLKGKKWKETLLATIAEAQKAVGGSPGPTPTPGAGETAALAALRAQVNQLQASLNQALAKITTLQAERDKLQSQLQQQTGSDGELTKKVQALTKQVQTLTDDKAALAQQTQALTAEKATLAQQAQTLTSDKTALTKQVQTLTASNTALTQQVGAATQEKQTLNKTISELQARIKQLEKASPTPTPSGPLTIQAPQITDVTDKLPKHATLKYDTRALSQITHIAIHHSAAPANVGPERIAAYHVGKDWPGMGYHFYVQPDGAIFQTNRLETVSYQVYQQNDYSLGICTAGNFMGGLIPTPKQIEAIGHLIAWLTQKLGVKLENVKGHKEFPENQTACPGTDWLAGKKWKDMVLAQVKARLAGQALPTAKSIGHYMLFWQRADAWAQEDWGAAAAYFARFRPTAGFSPDDAKTAEYVTIVGGVAGVPYETEQMLTAAGCKVERLAGADFADTKRMLDDLAKAGKRFKTLTP